MDSTARILPNYTYEDYIQWEGRWEVIEGIPFAMAPMPIPRHQRTASRLNAIIFNGLQKKQCSCEVYHPIDLKIRDNTIVNPDLLIVCQPIEKKYLDFPPIFVAEILSPSTRLKDLNSKKWLYQEFGIKYYLIVDLENDSLTLLKLDSNGAYQSVPVEDGLTLTEECHIYPDWSSVFE